MVFFIYVLFVEKSLFLKYVIYPIIIFLKILNINGDDTMSDFEGVRDRLYILLSARIYVSKIFSDYFHDKTIHEDCWFKKKCNNFTFKIL